MRREVQANGLDGDVRGGGGVVMQEIKIRMPRFKLPVDNILQLSTRFYNNSVVYGLSIALFGCRQLFTES